MAQVEFFFDVISPYSYLAYYELQKIAARQQAEIIWRPVLLGALFKATGNSSPIEIPAKRRHALSDLKRWAAHYQTPFQMNKAFPFNSLHLMRGAVGMQMKGNGELLRYLDVVFKAMFGDPRNLNDPAELAKTLDESGIDSQMVMGLIEDESVKARLKANTEEAIARGLFGLPTFFVGQDMYWGQDRLLFVEEALKQNR